MAPPRELVRYFDSLAATRDQWIERNWYYHHEIARALSFHIPPGTSVLEIGSSTGALLNAVNPGRGLGLDISPVMVEIARKKYPHLEFRVDDLEALTTDEKFDYVVLSDMIGFLNDVQISLKNLHRVCHRSTRILITHFHFLWEPILDLAERTGRKAKQPISNWLTPADIANLLELAGFEALRTSSRILLPAYVPLLSTVCNRILVNLPLIRHLGLVRVVVARPSRNRDAAGCPSTSPNAEVPPALSCSVIVPCRNERGNIASVVARIPEMPGHTEIIFVEGGSTDGTPGEIGRVIAANRTRDIKLITQKGRGKADAVWCGFDVAKGDLLMTLDGDLGVDPEELPKFYEAIADGTADFVQGSRLVYPMEGQAMRFLNLVGNRFFSLVFTYLLDQKLTDTLCGTKVLLRSDYHRIAASRRYFGNFDPFGDFDLIFGAAKLNLKIVEIPIHYRARTYGTTNISRFRHGVLLLRMTWYAIWKIKFV